jgi:MFS transporter, BCD family, chlorophyll transporter
MANWSHTKNLQRVLYLASIGASTQMTINAAKKVNAYVSQGWRHVGTRFLPFADAATAELPIGRLLRLSLFQVTVGMALALMVGTLNRVMIVELSVSASLVALMVALPLIFAPFRALIGFKSDTHVSVLGWRRVPYIWFGSLMQFGGLAIMPFALLILSGDTHFPHGVGHVSAAFAFLLVGAGLHTTQTAGLALATDLATPASRPRVVALMYVMLLVGMVVSSFIFSALLANFSQIRLVQVVQGAAMVTMILNVIALWKQEPRQPSKTVAPIVKPNFRQAWQTFRQTPGATRLLVAVGFGTAAFNMQDIILEPYGGEILKLSVAATSMLTALMAGGALVAFALAARLLTRGVDACRIAATGILVGIVAFSMVVFAAPLDSPTIFRLGATLVGFGGGLFAVATLTAAMNIETRGYNGLALGAWGAVQATLGGLAIAAGGVIRDVVTHMAVNGYLGEALISAAVGYSMVYHLEILLLFATLVVIGPLARSSNSQAVDEKNREQKFGLAEFPS